MKCIVILKDCRYAQHKPSLPILEFVKDKTYDLEDYLADSVINNKDGAEIETTDKPSGGGVEPETKEKPRKATKARGEKGK